MDGMGHWDEPRAAQPRAPWIALACAPTEHQFADTLTRDLRLRGATVETGSDSANADAPDWLIVVLSPAALRSPVIEQQMRVAGELFRRQRLRGALAIIAVPCPPADIPPHWPITRSFDATHNYGAALRHLCVAMEMAEMAEHAENVDRSQPPTTTTAPVLAPTSPDPAQQETVITPRAIAGAIDPAQRETAPIPALARPQSHQTTRTTRTTQSEERLAIAAGATDSAAGFRPNTQESATSAQQGLQMAARKKGITRRSLLGAGAVTGAVALAGVIFQVWRTTPQPRPALGAPTVRWRYLINSHAVTAAVERNGAIYFGAADGHYYALDAATHTLRWAYDTQGAIRPDDPVLEAGAVYCSATNGAVLKLSNDPGITSDAKRLLWRFRVPRQTVLTPTLSDGVLYVSCQRYRLFALDHQTGAVIWTDGTPFHPTSPVTPDGSRLYVAGLDAVFALTNGKHDTIWQTPTGGPVNQQMVLSKSVLYACMRMSRALAFDAATGALRWSFTTDGLLFSPPVLDERLGAVFVGDDSGYVYALDARRGALRWRQQLDNAVFSLRLFKGSIHVVSRGGYLYAFDPMTGAMRWQYVAGQGVVSPLGVGEDALYVSSADGYLYALNVPD
jgi:outer membrane protein assembly factor BamB